MGKKQKKSRKNGLGFRLVLPVFITLAVISLIIIIISTYANYHYNSFWKWQKTDSNTIAIDPSDTELIESDLNEEWTGISFSSDKATVFHEEVDGSYATEFVIASEDAQAKTFTYKSENTDETFTASYANWYSYQTYAEHNGWRDGNDQQFVYLAIFASSFAVLAGFMYACAFLGKKHKWANVVGIVFGGIFTPAYFMGIFSIVGGALGIKSLKKSSAEDEPTAEEGATELSREEPPRSSAKTLADYPVDYEHKPVVSQVLDGNNTANIILQSEKGVTVEFRQLYVNVYKDKLYLVAETVDVAEEDGGGIVVFEVDYDNDGFVVEQDESVCNAVFSEFQTATAGADPEADAEPREYIQPKMSPKGKKGIMIALTVCYSLLLLMGILLASVPAFAKVVYGMGICEEIAGRAYAMTIGVMWVALVPTFGYYFVTISPYALAKKHKIVIASATTGLLLAMNVVFFLVTGLVKIDGLVPVKEFFEGSDRWFVPLTMVFSSVGIIICYALTLFKISPERIDTRKPQQPSGHEFVAMIKYILQIIVYYVIIGAKKILIAKEKQPDIFILVTTVLLTWLAYFVSFIFAIVLIVVLVTVVIFAFAKMVKFSTDGMPSQSNSDVVYVSDGGYDVELRLSGASDGYEIYEDSAGNKYVSDDHGKTVRKMSWDDVVSDEEITTQK